MVNNRTFRIILQRFLISLGIILFTRVGSFVPIPGVNHTDLAVYIQAHPFARTFITNISGEDTFIIGLFTLNIFPYINASIIVQVLTALSPSLSKLRKEGDLKSRRSLNRLTRIITLILAIIQSVGLGLYLRQILFNWNLLLFLQITLGLTAGAMIVLWLSELITDFGLGNGASLLICTNIISNFPNLFKTLLIEANEKLNILSDLVLVGFIFTALICIIFLQEGVRRIPLISAKQLNQRVERNIDMYLPIKLTQAGVMPIIITTSILVLPGYLTNLGVLPIIELGMFSQIFYWIAYFGLTITFSLFYATIVLNPKDVSEQLQKTAVTIPGIRPGVQTTFYIKKVMQRLTFAGASILAILATLPDVLEAILNVSSLNGLSITSLLILSGVLIDILREVDEIFYSNIYNNNRF